MGFFAFIFSLSQPHPGQKSLLRSRKPGVLQFMGSERVGHDLGIEQKNNNQRVKPLLVFARARKDQ